MESTNPTAGLVLTELTLRSQHAAWAIHSLPCKFTLPLHEKHMEEVRGQKSSSQGQVTEDILIQEYFPTLEALEGAEVAVHI